MGKIAEKIIEFDAFKSKLKDLTKESVESLFPSLIIPEKHSTTCTDWNYMLFCASILARSEAEVCQNAALRIAQHCLSVSDTNENCKLAAIVILNTLTNNPSINLAIKRGILGQNYLDAIPIPLRLNMIRRDIDNSIIDERGRMIFLNRFQKKVFNCYDKYDCISISAPTSSGKSFILEKMIEEIFVTSDSKIVVYLVPTRALIHQTEINFNNLIDKKKVIITSIPELPKKWQGNCLLLIYTQERLQWVLNDAPSEFAVDFLVIDEAHKIDDGARGIILQQAIENVLKHSPNVKVFFSSPATSNPEVFFDMVPNDLKKDSLISNYVAVNQNLIWVSQVRGKPKEYTVDLCLEEDTINLGKIVLAAIPNPESKRTPFIACTLGDKNGGNLIYVNAAAAAETAALQLCDLLGRDGRKKDQELDDLVDLVGKVIHPEYNLTRILPYGVAFHYGNMPLLIREKIEDLFANGKIHFLFCTSTLLEGVNLPAKSIFIRGPRRGRGNPMDAFDFWNLAGRAGRLGKEFQGNIICVDPNDPNVWQEPPPRSKKSYLIKKAIDIVSEKEDKLLDFIRNEAPRGIAFSEPALENAFVYYYRYYKENNTLKNISSRSQNFLSELEQLMEGIDKKISLPLDLVNQNAGISPLAQQSLYDYFKAYNKNIEELIPMHPASESSVKESYLPLISRISKYLSGEHQALAYPHAIIAVAWIKGLPLGRIINSSIDYWENSAPVDKRRINKRPAIIRETMDTVEEFARFRFAKYSSGYINILKYFLKIENKDEYIGQVPKLHIWLEFGASLDTQIALMGLGLSRTSAIAISEFIANDTFGRDQCIEWLKCHDIKGTGLPLIVIEEINKILENL